MRINLVPQRQSGAESILRAVRKNRIARRARRRHRLAQSRRVEIAPMIPPRAGRKKPPRRNLNQILAENPPRPLPPARRKIRGGAGKQNLMARPNFFVVIKSRDQSLPLSRLSRPHRRTAHSLRRHRLQIRQRLAVAIARHRGKCLLISLRVRVKPQRQSPESTQLQIRSERSLSELGIVPLQRRAVPACFVQIPSARENLALLADFSPHHKIRSPVPPPCVHVE